MDNLCEKRAVVAELIPVPRSRMGHCESLVCGSNTYSCTVGRLLNGQQLGGNLSLPLPFDFLLATLAERRQPLLDPRGQGANRSPPHPLSLLLLLPISP